MRADELMVISVGEYEELKAKAKAGSGQLFDAEEMQAIREQYAERVEAAEARRDELEWKLRVELAKIRDAELHSRRAADEMRRIELSLAALISDEEDPTQVRSTGPSAKPTIAPVAPKPQAKAPVALPPPLPPMSAAPTNGHANGNGHTNGSSPTSQAEKFKLAMQNRKRYTA